VAACGFDHARALTVVRTDADVASDATFARSALHRYALAVAGTNGSDSDALARAVVLLCAGKPTTARAGVFEDVGQWLFAASELLFGTTRHDATALRACASLVAAGAQVVDDRDARRDNEPDSALTTTMCARVRTWSAMTNANATLARYGLAQSMRALREMSSTNVSTSTSATASPHVRARRLLARLASVLAPSADVARDDVSVEQWQRLHDDVRAVVRALFAFIGDEEATGWDCVHVCMFASFALHRDCVSCCVDSIAIRRRTTIVASTPDDDGDARACHASLTLCVLQTSGGTTAAQRVLIAHVSELINGAASVRDERLLLARRAIALVRANAALDAERSLLGMRVVW
jgi:hypothetical protein